MKKNYIRNKLKVRAMSFKIRGEKIRRKKLLLA